MIKRKRGRPIKADESIGPTPETQAKKQPSPLEGFSEELERAGIALQAGFDYISCDLLAKAQTYHPRIPGKRAELSGGKLYWVLRYQEWVREANRRGHHVECVISLLVDGMSLDECNRRFWPYLRPGPARAKLEQSLKLYAKTIVPDLESRLRVTGDWPLTPARIYG